MKHIVIFNVRYRKAATYFAENCLNANDEVFFAQLSSNEIDRKDDINILKRAMAERRMTFETCQVHLIYTTHTRTVRMGLFAADDDYNASTYLNLFEFLREGKGKSYLEVIHSGEFGDLSPDWIKNAMNSKHLNGYSAFNKENIRVHQESAITNFVTSIAKLFKPSQPIIDLLRRDTVSVDKVVDENRAAPK